MPPWFGDAQRPAVRIAGHVFGGDGPITVHLLLDVPDPAVWPGIELRTSAGGDFDFGDLRAGEYALFAEGGGRLSHLVHVSTLGGARDDVEIFVRDAARVERTFGLARTLVAGDDWNVPYVFWKERRIESWQPSWVPLVGVVHRHDGSPAAGVGVQPIECAIEHSPYHGLPTIATTSATGAFTLYVWQTDICGLRIYLGPKRHEVEVERWRNEPVAVELPAQGAEQRDVFSWGFPAGDPRGAWIRGKVTSEGRAVADARVSVVVMHSSQGEGIDATYSRSDGSFELYVSSPSLARSHAVLLAAFDALGELGGKQVVRIAPGEHREVAIEAGAGAIVSGVVVDDGGAPVPGMKLRVVPWARPITSASDGSFRARLWQGRHQVLAIAGPGSGREVGASEKIDITRPRGEHPGLRVVIRRDKQRECCTVGDSASVALGADVTWNGRVVGVADELEAAGLRAGDWIVEAKVDGETTEHLWRAVAPPWGAHVELTVERDGKQRVIAVTAPTFGGPSP